MKRPASGAGAQGSARRLVLLPAAFALLFAVGFPGRAPRATAGERSAAALPLRRAIKAGSDADDPPVVGLLSGQHVVCTGTLIAPRRVLGAAHCVPESADAGSLPRVLFGPQLEASHAVIVEVAAVHRHERYDALRRTNDLAVLVLAAPAPAAPLPLRRRPLDERVIGQRVRVVGHGHASAGHDDAHRLRSGTALIGAFSESIITLLPDPALPCAGDSGGPVLLDEGGAEEVIAIVRSGGTSCASSADAVRVDPHVSGFLMPHLMDDAPAGGCSL